MKLSTVPGVGGRYGEDSLCPSLPRAREGNLKCLIKEKIMYKDFNQIETGKVQQPEQPTGQLDNHAMTVKDIVSEAVSQPVAALWKRIFPCKE